MVITGIGVVSPAGCTLPEFWEALLAGRSAIGPIALPRADAAPRIAAQVGPAFDPERLFEPRQLRLLDRFAQFAVAASRAALADSGLVLTEALAATAVSAIASAAGGQNTQDEGSHRIYGEGAARLHPFTVPRVMASAAASQVCMDLELKGPSFCVATACAAGTHSIGMAFHLLRAGAGSIAFAGGAEACLTLGTVLAWEALKVLAPDTCRPFSRGRAGLALGEGAAVLLLEERGHALARGARIYAELTGFGMSADAFDITAPDPAGAARAMRAALQDAGCAPERVGYVNAHGTGTAQNDRAETQALQAVFGGHLPALPVSSVKAVLGHGLGAAGALEMAATALALYRQTIPPTANFLAPDPECNVDAVPNTARDAKFEVAMSNSFAFGGLNAVLLAARA